MTLNAVAAALASHALTLGRRLAALWPSLSLNASGVAGLGFIAYGAHEIYHPLGWLVLGLELAGAALLTAIARARDAAKAPE